jgi:hypothetical protein
MSSNMESAGAKFHQMHNQVENSDVHLVNKTHPTVNCIQHIFLFPTSSLFGMLSASQKPCGYIFTTSEKDTLELAQTTCTHFQY